MKFRFSLSTNIIISLIAGTGCGIFFGEYCSGLRIFGDVFIQLLQMSILPFIAVSLIAGMGRLSYGEAKMLAIKAGGFLFLFWGIAFAIILLMPLSFPSLKSASFFSSSVLESREPIDFLQLFIPSNPFRSLVNTFVPAVVLFSIAVGIALIGVKEKQGLITGLSAFSAALTRLANFIVYLTPIGVFAIAASTAGTMTIDEFGRLQVYFFTFVVAALLLTFWVLPMLLTTITPFKYRDCVGLSRNALLTGFTTGSLFIIIPLLIDNCKQLFEKYRLEQKKTGSLVEIIIPVSFNFPTTGKLLALLFIPFAAWFSASSFSIKEYPEFVFLGLSSMFAGANISLPFMLDSFNIPSDLFQLFIGARVLTDRFKTLLSAMNLLIFTVVTICAISRLLTIRWRKLLRYTVLTITITLVTIMITRAYFIKVLDLEYTRYKSFVEMKMLFDPVPVKIHKSLPTPLKNPRDSSISRLEAISKRGFIRVGYFKDSLPFAFTNSEGTLVGFDIEMAHLLAKALDVSLEFVRIDREKVAALLNDGYCDIVMSGVAITSDRLREMAFSLPYMDNTVGFIVKDHRRDEFKTLQSIQSLEAPRIGVPNSPHFIAKVQKILPHVILVPLNSPREFFKRQDLDAFIFTAEAGSAWTLIYPEYAVVVPQPDSIKAPLAYPIAQNDQRMINFINAWIGLRMKDKTIEKLFDHWVLGHGADKKEPRWSIIRNVLHWVD